MEDESLRRYGFGVSEEALRSLVQAVLAARAPDKLAFLHGLPLTPSMTSITEEIRETLSDELVEVGLGPDGEPNDRGRLIEAAIDWLGHGLTEGRPNDRQA